MNEKTYNKLYKHTLKAKHHIRKLIKIYEEEGLLSASELDTLGVLANNLTFSLDDVKPDRMDMECFDCENETEHMITYNSLGIKQQYACVPCWDANSG